MRGLISRPLLAAIEARAAASPHAEICGLLLGSRSGDGVIVEAAPPTTNVACQPADRFEIDPAALIAAYRTERGGGATLLGHYHSHPRGPAVPSPHDAAAAEPGRLWLILGAGTARLWRAGERGRFEEIALTVA